MNILGWPTGPGTKPKESEERMKANYAKEYDLNISWKFGFCPIGSNAKLLENPR